MAVAPGAAGLAGYGVHAHRLGYESIAPSDRDQRHLPAIFQSHAGITAARPGQPLAGARAAFSIAGGDDPGSGALCGRADGGKGRRSIGETLSASEPLEGTVECRLSARSRGKFIPPQFIHVLAT